jgi:nitric oxide dioxygenase
MESVRNSRVEQHVPEVDIHYEVFGPDKWLASA